LPASAPSYESQNVSTKRNRPISLLRRDNLDESVASIWVADHLSAGLEAGRLPDMASLRERFSSDPAALPVVTVRLAMKW